MYSVKQLCKVYKKIVDPFLNHLRRDKEEEMDEPTGHFQGNLTLPHYMWQGIKIEKEFVSIERNNLLKFKKKFGVLAQTVNNGWMDGHQYTIPHSVKTERETD